jgi:hypothetical protein
MDSLYRLFALAWLAEREAWRNVQQWETIAAAQGKPEPRYATDAVYASLVDEWDAAHTELKDVEKVLTKEYRKMKAEGTFTVLSAQ